MKLIDSLEKDRASFIEAGYRLPRFDRKAVTERTLETPEWIHFGAGNIFRAFIAAAHQKTLEAGGAETGLVVVGGHDFEVIDLAYRPYDNLTALATLNADGTVDKTVIGSVVKSVTADPRSADWDWLAKAFRSPSLQMVSLTITEKGYSLTEGRGEYRNDVLRDFAEGPAHPSHTIGRLAALCHERFVAGGMPVALVSMDNCARNGDRLRASVIPFANAWVRSGLAKPGFVEWLLDPAKVSYPWTMIDKITPRPDASVSRILAESGLEDTVIRHTSGGAYVAPFVNAEAAEYLVVEDSFPNGRPALEKGGILFTERETVEKVERMKVGSCLNPLHTALAIFGCLLGHTLISEEMKDPQLRALIERLGYEEGLPVAEDPGIVKPRDFLREVIEQRLPNPFLPDTPQRIACDTSQKLPIRFGGTLKAWNEDPGRDAKSLRFVPLVFAGWLRYLTGIDDAGKFFEPSPDPLLPRCRDVVAGLSLGDEGPFGERLGPLLSDASIFGLDLKEIGLADRVEGYFAEMMAAPGAVRKLLVTLLS